MDTVVIVVVDVAVDCLNHLTCRFEAVEITQLVLEAPKERLDITVLPGRCHITDGDLDAPLVKLIRTALRHEFSALVRVKDERRHPSCERLVEGR